MSPRQKGMGLVITVLLILVVAIVAVLVATSFSSSSVRDSGALADSTEALYLAETGIERAIKRFATGTPCDATLQDASATELIAGSGKTFQITKAATTDFSGVAALVPSLTQCRVEAEGKINSSNVSRKLQAIIDKNLLGGANNEDYNNPAAAGAPSSWTLDPATGFANNGGPDGTAPSCSRSAWLARESVGAAAANDRTASGTTNVQFTVTAGSTTTVSFHRRTVPSPAGCSTTTFTGTFPCSTTANDGTVCFQMTGAGGPWTSASENANTTGAAGSTCPSTFNPCSTSYSGSPTKINLAFPAMPATSSVTGFSYYMQLRRSGRKEIFIDNIEAVNDTAIGAARVQYWRDCTVASCP